MEATKINDVLEALLFSADVPLRAKTLAEVLGDGVAIRDVNAAVKELNARYTEAGAAFRIEEIAGGLQLLTRSEFDVWVKKLAKARQRARLSRAALETLAIIAYRQPLTRPAIEAIRGVDAGGVLGTLLERGLVRIPGRADTVGRPHLYATTPTFLNHFGLKSLSKLPRMDEITKEMDRRGLVQDVARELGEDPEGLDEAIDAFIVGGAADAAGAGSAAGDGDASDGPDEAATGENAVPAVEEEKGAAEPVAAPEGARAPADRADASEAVPAGPADDAGPSIDAPGPPSMTVAALTSEPGADDGSSDADPADEETGAGDGEGGKVGAAREAL